MAVADRGRQNANNLPFRRLSADAGSSRVARHLTNSCSQSMLWTDEDFERAPQGVAAFSRGGWRGWFAGGGHSKIRDNLAFLYGMEAAEELHNLRLWRTHQLIGDRAGTWAMHVTKNWRITFSIDERGIEIIDLDYEDYHLGRAWPIEALSSRTRHTQQAFCAARSSRDDT